MVDLSHQIANKSDKASIWRRISDSVVHILLFFFYLIYFIFKGRESRIEKDPTACLVNKPSLQPIPTSSNVCCIHGVQTRLTYEQSSAVSSGSKVQERQANSVNLPTALQAPPAPPLASSFQTRRIDYSDKIVYSKEANRRDTEICPSFHQKNEKAGPSFEQNGSAVVGSQESVTRAGLLSRVFGWLHNPFDYLYSFFRTNSKKSIESKKEPNELKKEIPIPAGQMNGVMSRSEILPVPQRYQPASSPQNSKPTAEPIHYPVALMGDKTHASSLRDNIGVSKLQSVGAFTESKPFLHEWNKTKGDLVPSPPPPPSPPLLPHISPSIRPSIEPAFLKETHDVMGQGEDFVKATPEQAIWHSFYQQPQKAEIRIKTTYGDSEFRTVQPPRKDIAKTEDLSKSFDSIQESHLHTSVKPPLAPPQPRPATLIRPTALHDSAAFEKRQFEDQMTDRKAFYEHVPSQEHQRFEEIEAKLSPPQPKDWLSSEHSYTPNLGTGHSFKKYTRYYYKKSSYHTSDEPVIVPGMHFPRQLRNPQSGFHDTQFTPSEYCNKLMADIASPEKFREVSRVLSSPDDAERGVELFRKQKQRMESFVVNEAKPIRVSSMPPPLSRPNAPSIDDVIESVHQAAGRHHDQSFFKPIRDHGSMPPVAPSVQRYHAGDMSLTREFETLPARSQVQSWTHERLFSPVPFGQRPYATSHQSTLLH